MDSEQRSWVVRGGSVIGHSVEDSSVRRSTVLEISSGHWHRLSRGAGRFIWQRDEGMRV